MATKVKSSPPKEKGGKTVRRDTKAKPGPKQPKAPAPKPAPKKAGKGGAVKTAGAGNALAPFEARVLALLGASKVPMTRADLIRATGVRKGWSRLMGTVTKDNGGTGLEGRGLVRSEPPDRESGERGHRYVITARGRAVLGRAA